jgi:glutathione S-transferase
MIEIYTDATANGLKVSIGLEELGLEYKVHRGFLGGDQMTPEFTALNPNNKIPVLVHGDFILWESHAIMQYVAELTPGQALYPYAPRERADVNRWLFWHNAHFAPPLGTLGWERVWKKLVTGQGPDEAACARGDREWATVATIIDAHLAGRAYLVGDSLSLADLSIAATVANAGMYGADLASYPQLRALHDRVAALPAWAATAAPAFAPPQPAAAPQPRVG